MLCAKQGLKHQLPQPRKISYVIQVVRMSLDVACMIVWTWATWTSALCYNTVPHGIQDSCKCG